MQFVRFLIPFVILIISCISFSFIKETFVSYTISPCKYLDTGSNPLGFYNKPRYRNPYRWPYRYIKSYPYSHFSPL